MNTSDLQVWTAARSRAAMMADLVVFRCADGDSWDHVAVRDLIAVAVYAIARRDARPAGDVGLDETLVLLGEPDRYREFAATAVEQAGGDSPVAAAWRWLTREWDPDDEPGRRWDGLRRGIARGVCAPAVEVCLDWAANAVSRALEDQRGALPRRTAVQVTGGPHLGAQGVIEAPSWALGTIGALAAGPPGAYLVRISTTDDAELRHITANNLVPQPPAAT